MRYSLQQQPDLLDHPLYFVEDVCNSNSRVEKLEFSYYVYTPRSVEDERRVRKVSATDLRSAYRYLKKELEQNEEIAFHSRVHMKSGDVRHLPILDLSGEFTRERIEKIIGLANHVFSGLDLGDLAIFESGRSCHVYGSRVLSQDEWYELLGRSLLANLPNEKDVVDQRWVGHRLMAGYGTLRWTCNTDQYLQEPTESYRLVSAESGLKKA